MYMGSVLEEMYARASSLYLVSEKSIIVKLFIINTVYTTWLADKYILYLQRWSGCFHVKFCRATSERNAKAPHNFQQTIPDIKLNNE